MQISRRGEGCGATTGEEVPYSHSPPKPSPIEGEGFLPIC